MVREYMWSLYEPAACDVILFPVTGWNTVGRFVTKLKLKYELWIICHNFSRCFVSFLYNYCLCSSIKKKQISKHVNKNDLCSGILVLFLYIIIVHIHIFHKYWYIFILFRVLLICFYMYLFSFIFIPVFHPKFTFTLVTLNCFLMNEW